MPITLLSRIFPFDIAEYIYNFVKINKCINIYWNKLYMPSSLIIDNIIKQFSNYNIPSNLGLIYNSIHILYTIIYPIKQKGFLQKNIYIFLDEYIDKLNIMKKHLNYHHNNYYKNDIFFGCAKIIKYLDKFID